MKSICEEHNSIALPDSTCNQIDVMADPYFFYSSEQKGAWFLRDVATLLGVGTLDQAIAEFYKARVGKAARMQELIDHIKTKATSEQATQIDSLAESWLRTLACPIDTSGFTC